MLSAMTATSLSFIPFQIPTLVDTAPSTPGWLHEIKLNGYRTQIIVDRGIARAFTRNGHNWTARN